jgi:hypothetical protein
LKGRRLVREGRLGKVLHDSNSPGRYLTEKCSWSNSLAAYSTALRGKRVEAHQSVSVAERVVAARSRAETQVGVEHAPCGYVEGVSGQQRCLDFAPLRWLADSA